MGALRATVNWAKLGWTKKLDRWWNEEGRSAKWIADRLGVSRGAVLGKVHRMGWSGSEKHKKPPAKKWKPMDKPMPSLPKCAPKRALPSMQKDIVPEEGDPPLEERVHLLDLQIRHCRWPLFDEGGSMFCGRRTPTAQGPYCEEHARRAYKAKSPGTKPLRRS